MRRRFNQNILPKEAPPKGKCMKTSANVGTPFQKWFRGMLKKHDITLKKFCELSGAKYQTACGWRYRNEPRTHGRMDIAWGFYLLGAGTYDELYKEIKGLCRYP